MTRIAAAFSRLAAEGRAGFIPFVMGGDPDFATSLRILEALPAAGADLIELGVAFSDPMADGPAIQAAGLRALKGGQTLAKTLELARAFRRRNDDTPLILMGYFNPILAYGVGRFLDDARTAGIDGLIVVDLPPEEDAELCLPARAAGLDFIRLATPTTDAQRLPAVLKNVSGFIYYVAVAGTTGAKSADPAAAGAAAAALKTAAGLPVAVGFGVRTPAEAAAVALRADAVVVGSALVERVAAGTRLGSGGADAIIDEVLGLARHLSGAIRAARGSMR